MNKIWLTIMLSSVTVMLFINPVGTLPTMLAAAKEAAGVAFSFLAVYTVWLGLFAILDATGINGVLARFLSPLIKWLYGDLPPLTASRISLNMSANMLGLGGAATPMGIEATRLLDDGSGKATDSMIMFIVVNATSIQLLPTTLIGIRAAFNSASPADIILPSLIATLVTTALGIFLCKVCAKISKRIAAKKKPNNKPALSDGTQKEAKGKAAV